MRTFVWRPIADIASGSETNLATRRTCWFDDHMRDPQTPRIPTDEDLLEELRQLLEACGKLSSSLIEASKITRAPNTYICRFGSLVAAYARVGYTASERQRVTSERFRMRGRRADPAV